MRYLSWLLAALMAVPFSPIAGAQTAPAKLNLVIVEGDGAINNIRQRTAREPVVQVEDENHKPIAGAVVVFLLPNQGAGGTFANGARTLTVISDDQGRAVARGLRPNSGEGQYQIHVNASFGGQTATATITQTNAVGAAAGGGATAAAAGVSGKLIAVLVVVGAAAAGGIAYAATHSSGSSSSSATIGSGASTTTISAGAGTVGPPR
jgi:hypothetical protein